MIHFFLSSADKKFMSVAVVALAVALALLLSGAVHAQSTATAPALLVARVPSGDTNAPIAFSVPIPPLGTIRLKYSAQTLSIEIGGAITQRYKIYRKLVGALPEALQCFSSGLNAILTLIGVSSGVATCNGILSGDVLYFVREDFVPEFLAKAQQVIAQEQPAAAEEGAAPVTEEGVPLEVSGEAGGEIPAELAPSEAEAAPEASPFGPELGDLGFGVDINGPTIGSSLVVGGIEAAAPKEALPPEETAPELATQPAAPSEEFATEMSAPQEAPAQPIEVGGEVASEAAPQEQPKILPQLAKEIADAFKSALVAVQNVLADFISRLLVKPVPLAPAASAVPPENMAPNEAPSDELPPAQ